MPLYEYQCQFHGMFERMRSMGQSSDPVGCPDCGASSARVLSAVRGAQLPASEVKARDRNIRSQHEPRLVKAEKKQATGERPKLQRSSHSRPWALEHG